MTVSAPLRTPDPALVADLKVLLGDRVSTAAAVRDHHGRDLSYHTPHPPDVVVFPLSTEEVSEIVKICARRRVPMIPFGAGTSLEGHVAAIHGGVSIDLMGMNKVLAIHAEDMDVVVQPGVTRKRLNEQLRDTGLFFPVDPGADASIGGMVATGASGTNAVRYGTMRETVLSLTVVLADGRIIKTRSRARKSSAGYDLTRLFIGSEGTLGIITEITLKLFGIPEAISAATVAFDTLHGAVNSVIETIQSGIPIARIELLDELQVEAVNKYSKMSLPLKPTLFLEFHGSQAGVKEQVESVEAICGGHGGGHFQWSVKPEERTALWQARHDAAYAGLALRPGAKGWATDVCVPISRLADCILETKEDIKNSFIIAPIVGHVGDGNFHLVMLLDPDDPKETAEAQRLNKRLIDRALRMEGTSTGEHGVGMGKMDCLVAELGEAVTAMRAVKRALDPDNLMNPGKIVASN